VRHILLLAVALPLADGPALPPLNAKVLEFAREHQGKQVGDGQCLALAVEALSHAGAKRYPVEGAGDFVWGRRLDSTAEALPGDVLQFRDAVFKGEKVTSSSRRWWTHTFAHHTAVVARVRKTKKGLLVTVLHQNVGPTGRDESRRKVVQETTLNMAELQPGGHVWAYRPVEE
jgi:hypothetical protein